MEAKLRGNKIIKTRISYRNDAVHKKVFWHHEVNREEIDGKTYDCLYDPERLENRIALKKEMKKHRNIYIEVVTGSKTEFVTIKALKKCFIEYNHVLFYATLIENDRDYKICLWCVNFAVGIKTQICCVDKIDVDQYTFDFERLKFTTDKNIVTLQYFNSPLVQCMVNITKIHNNVFQYDLQFRRINNYSHKMNYTTRVYEGYLGWDPETKKIIHHRPNIRYILPEDPVDKNSVSWFDEEYDLMKKVIHLLGRR